ncbi:hypothetical protein BC826DRAFT_602396 [Russula brevipes]|nr:hypothetical protein BC826DRAFT_602396 [Russula brevipes]
MEDKVRPLHPYTVPTRVLPYSGKVTMQSREADYSRIYYDNGGCLFFPGPFRWAYAHGQDCRIIQYSQPLRQQIIMAPLRAACCSWRSLRRLYPRRRAYPKSFRFVRFLITGHARHNIVLACLGAKQKEKKKKNFRFQFHEFLDAGCPPRFHPSRDCEALLSRAGVS